MFSLWSSMGWYWLIAPLAAAAIGILAVFNGIVSVFSGRPGAGAARLAVGGPLAVLGVAASLIALNTQTFARLSHEGEVAQVQVKALDPARQIYAVTVQRTDGSNISNTCTIQGDEWEIAARVQKWKSWANVLGLDATYSLDQVSNKYFDGDRANGRPVTSCSLKGAAPAVNQYVPKHWLFWLLNRAYTEDRRFGSAAYMPLADGAVYRVVMTQSGLNAEPANDVANAANTARP